MTTTATVPNIPAGHIWVGGKTYPCRKELAAAGLTWDPAAKLWHGDPDDKGRRDIAGLVKYEGCTVSSSPMPTAGRPPGPSNWRDRDGHLNYDC